MNEALVLLLLLWALILLPGALRSRRSSPHATVGGFARAMDVLRAKPGQGRELMVPGDAGRIVSHGLSRDPADADVRRSFAARERTAGEQAPAPRSASRGRSSRDATSSSQPRLHSARRGEDPVIARRRAWFLRLLAATGASLLLAVTVGGWLWLPLVMAVLVTGGYVALLRHLKLQHDRARRVVRDLDIHRPVSSDRSEWPATARAEGAGAVAAESVRLRRWDA